MRATVAEAGSLQRHRSRVCQHHRQHQMTETSYCGMYVDNIWLATSINNREFDVCWMSTQLDQLIQSGNLQPAPLALHDLGGVSGQYHLRWPPHLVDLRASTSMMHSAPEGYSYLGITPDNTPLWWSEVESHGFSGTGSSFMLWPGPWWQPRVGGARYGGSSLL